MRKRADWFQGLNTTETTQWPATSASVFPYITSPSGPCHSCRRSPFGYYNMDSDSSSCTSCTSSSTITSSVSSSETTSVLYLKQNMANFKVFINALSCSDCSGYRPRRAARGSSQSALSPKSTGGKAECTRRDVATATDTLPPYGRWGDWIGGEKLLMVGAVLLSILLIASAAATTASFADRRSTVAGGAAVAPTDPLLPGLIPFTEFLGQGDSGTVYSQASAKTSWKSSTDEEAEETDSTTEEPATGYGNASGDLVAVEDPLAMPFRRAAKPECGAVFYTYCRKPRREFLYRASLNACLAAADDRPAQLCNRGTNRFSSWRDCERKCVLTEPPHERCEDKTLLVGCRRTSALAGGGSMAGCAWPGTSQPVDALPTVTAVFATANQCTARCTNRRYPPCTTPRTVPCSSEQLKFPFFAAEAPSSAAVRGRRHCFRLTRRVLESHRCLTGANRFMTKAACEQACKKPRSTRP
ncbi:hypothetical protein HPB51_027965 [Rhipicephalus microplus]|uniref:Uncharacterized protein n=1 Tax=Rhipicephalus microplus TaxID=6941 RepID=A0A9J6CYM2_RHIMP|nr:hypothetical protein HPB51_027965 [Rhipicephalus microplus]